MESSISKFKKYIDPLIKGNKDSDNIIHADLKKIGYDDAFHIQEYLFNRITEDKIRGFIVLLEHLPVITIGSNRSTSNLLADGKTLQKKGIELVQSNRGGDITFHGPGQLVCYPIFDLSRFRKDLTEYVFNLEEVIIKVLSCYGLEGERIKGLRGVFIGKQKIASIGVRVKKWITMHGFSFNISVDLQYFDNIVACGLREHEPISLNKILGKDIPIDNVKEQVLKKSEEVFGITIL
jgi:lipoate-protein ligase B